MSVGTLVKVPIEVASVPIDQIKWGQIMLVDPRDYKVSAYNARIYDKDRNTKALEDSILNHGFRMPLLSDEKKEIVDGSRRHRIALKHGLMIPVIHTDYSQDMRDPIVLRAIDSILYNSQEANTPRELGELLNLISKTTGIPLTKVSGMLGTTWSTVNNWTQQGSIPSDVIPEELQTPEFKEVWDSISSRKREVVTRVTKSLEGTPREKAETAMKLAEAGYDTLDEVSRDINNGIKVELEDRLKGSEPGIKSVTTKLEWSTEMHSLLTQKARARTWDTLTTIQVRVWLWLIGEQETTQNDYDRFRAAQKADFNRSTKK